MPRTSLYLAVAIVVATNPWTFGQSFLNKLEERLQKAASAVTGAEPAPGSGYLGAVLDEDQGGRGVRVNSVRPGAPADLGGLKGGDLIIEIDTKPITKMDDLDAVLNKAIPKQRLRLTVDRGGKQQPLNILLGTRQAATTPGAPVPSEPAAVPPPSLAPTLTNPADPASPAPPLLSPPTTSDPAASASLPIPSAAPSISLPATPAPATTPGAIRSQPLDLSIPPAEPRPADPAPAEPPAEPRPSIIDSLPSPAPSASTAPGVATSPGGASLGIMVDNLTEETRLANGLPVRRGALITSVRPGSPAAQAGLREGGAVVTFDGRRIDSDDDLVAAIRGARAGQEVELGYYQGDRLSKKLVRLGAAGGSTALGSAAPYPGSPTSPLRAGPLGLGRGTGSSDRPLLGKVERLVDGFSSRAAPSPLSNPNDMADLAKSVTQLTEQVRALEERLKVIESKVSGPVAPPIAPPSSGFVPANP